MANLREDRPCEVTITAPNRKWLQDFVQELVRLRLAAAGHVDMMSTTYRWGGHIHHADEARATLHTTLTRVAEITTLCQEQHEYEVPCVVSREIVSGNYDYLRWIADETEPVEISSSPRPYRNGPI